MDLAEIWHADRYYNVCIRLKRIFGNSTSKGKNKGL